MRIGITGGTGFVGRYIVKKLLTEGHQLTLLINSTPPQDDIDVQLIRGGLFNDSAIEELTKNCDMIIHCAGLTSAKRKNDFFTVNSQATSKLVQALSKHKNKRFLLISSLAAREPQISSYAASKKQAEEHLSASKDLGWDIIRPPAIYGPEDLHFLTVPEFLKKGFAPRLGADSVRLSLIHVQDLASAVAAWVRAPNATGQIYEVADTSPNGYSWKEIYETIAPLVTHKTIKHFRLPAFIMFIVAVIGGLFTKLLGKTPFLTTDKIREALHENWVCHNEPFNNAFNWKAQINLHDGMNETINWYKAHKYL